MILVILSRYWGVLDRFSLPAGVNFTSPIYVNIAHLLSLRIHVGMRISKGPSAAIGEFPDHSCSKVLSPREAEGQLKRRPPFTQKSWPVTKSEPCPARKR